jgi:hypothetical protein
MDLKDHLSAFSMEDLRELAVRRGVALSPSALKGRQTLVRTLSGALERPDTVYGSVVRLNQAELAVLHAVLHAGRSAGLSRLSATGKTDPAAVKEALESLRLWGLLFPEGDWEHIAVPPPTKMAASYLPGGRPEPLAELLAPPRVETAPGVTCTGRPGSLGRDVAELLARIARSRLKLTQAGRMNRRDLRAMEPAFGVQASGYSTFLYMLAGAIGLLAQSGDILVAPKGADVWLAQPEEVRARIAALSWVIMRGYPESVTGDPLDYDYVPVQIPDQRSRVLELARGLGGGTTASVPSLAARLVWMMPLAFQHWSGSRDAPQVTAKICRSLYWLGLAAVDDPEKPGHVQPTPLALRTLSEKGAEGPALVPEETQFFLQPNAEIFAPPNLSPRTYFHLRRITGEKKGGAEGMYPLTADSVRRALDTGLAVEGVNGFLERFSRTGLPGNVKALVETTGRQHGRIRLIPAGYVLLTDEPQLMEELRQVKTVAPLVGEAITERVALLDEASVAEITRRLRARGYAPLNLAETAEGPPLPHDPDTVPPLSEAALSTAIRVVLPEAMDEDEPDEGIAEEDLPPPATTPREIKALLRLAKMEGLVVQIEYGGAGGGEPALPTLGIMGVGYRDVSAFCFEEDEERTYELSQIRSARLTGEACDWDEEDE